MIRYRGNEKAPGLFMRFLKSTYSSIYHVWLTIPECYGGKKKSNLNGHGEDYA